MIRSPLGVQCPVHGSPIGIPCAPDGTCCARRIARALFLAAGVVPDGREATETDKEKS